MHITVKQQFASKQSCAGAKLSGKIRHSQNYDVTKINQNIDQQNNIM